MRLKKDIRDWIDNNRKISKDEGRDTVLQDMTDLTMLLVNITKNCSCGQLLSELPFSKWGFGYQKEMAIAIDEKMHDICRGVMSRMDHYQNRYKDYHVNIKDSSALCHTYYITLKKLVQVLRRNITRDQQTECQPPKLKLSEFHSWFNESFLHLLQAFRSECYLRTTRAVELDTRSTLMNEDGGGHFSNSAVYVLSCFAEILTEWKQLGLEQKELHFAFLVKLTDVICDATKLYTEMMEQKALTYCKNCAGQFIVPMQVCTSLNNIDHVWDYVKVLPDKMTWEEMEPDEEIKGQTLEVLHKLLDSTEKQVEHIKEKILNSVLEYIYINVRKEIQNWLKIFNQSKDEQKLIAYMDKNLCILHQNTRNNICNMIYPKLWDFILTETTGGFQAGLKPEYATTISKNLKASRDYLLFLGMDESCSREIHEDLTRILKLNSYSSIELQLEYYYELSCNVKTPLEYIGHVAFRSGFKEVTKGTIDIVVKVLNAQNLPKQDYSGSCDPFAVIELCPQAMFPGFRPQRTKTLYQIQDPVWDETFCNLPSTILSMKGAVVHFMIMDKDTVSSDFTGEFFVKLESILDMSKLASIDFLPVQMIPLKHYTNEQNTFYVIEKRSSWDKHSKLFMQTRVKYLREEQHNRSCSAKKITCCIFS
ncbi:protein unc-13 homolog D-like [Centruroides vittatus]|uniref:protein unc-13 homolog D-like n=1 Tax=Centruroides vittatus TaxID=120091 RepID=UPI00350F46BE